MSSPSVGPDDPVVVALAVAIANVLNAITCSNRGAADDLVALADSGLDARTRRRFEREGRLPVVKLGRRKFTTRAALLALVSAPTKGAEVAPPASDATAAARAAYASATLHLVRGTR
jgi:hypothetical protein